jgi:hypothetical protein
MLGLSKTKGESGGREPNNQTRREGIMLKNIKELYGHKLNAMDGEIGRVRDFFFDDRSWAIRYLVADTGSWMEGKMVLLAPHSFGRLNQGANELDIKLTRSQIESSPPIDAHKPVSRQYEIDYYRYYGWPVYWDGGGMTGLRGYPIESTPARARIDEQLHIGSRNEGHLRSLNAITGYYIHATDGLIGSVSALMVDDSVWAVRDFVVDAGHWYAGREILISTGNIESISYEDSKVFVNLTKADIQATAANEVAAHATPIGGQ